MATFKYFSDISGEPVELSAPQPMRNAEFAARFPGVKARRYDGYSMWVGRCPTTRELLPVTRMIEYKSRPSLHVCNAKCMGGKANGACECRCGGKNHGRSSVAGLFTGLKAA